MFVLGGYQSDFARNLAREGKDLGELTFVSDLRDDTSECQIFAADRLADRPIARVRLPERICAGSHACWAPTGG